MPRSFRYTSEHRLQIAAMIAGEMVGRAAALTLPVSEVVNKSFEIACALVARENQHRAAEDAAEEAQEARDGKA